MSRILTLGRRELAAYFCSPIAYVVLGLFAVGTALLFFGQFAPGQPASLRQTFGALVWFMAFLVPAISMRLVSEELRSGTLETLMTAPVTDAELIAGKWLGAMGFFLVLLLLPLLALVGVLEMYADPDYGPILTGFFGLLLVGGLYLAIGTFASAMNENQIIAFLLTVFIIAMLTILLFFLPQAEWVSGPMRRVMVYLNVNRQYEDFSKGLIDTSNLLYFLTGTGMFLFFAVQLVQSRRWR